jgi:2-dehydro-3-deoxygluconokinase
MGLRVTPENGQPVLGSDVLHLQATSAETNVASISSYLGLPVKVLTAFVKDSPFAAFIKSNLRARGMSYEGPDVPQGRALGATGIRLTWLTAATAPGAPRVWNDRAGEVGRDTERKRFRLGKDIWPRGRADRSSFGVS